MKKINISIIITSVLSGFKTQLKQELYSRKKRHEKTDRQADRETDNKVSEKQFLRVLTNSNEAGSVEKWSKIRTSNMLNLEEI